MPSFDVVSEINLQEVRNAVDQVRREIATRFDFKGSKSSIELVEDKEIVIVADDKMKLTALQDMLRQKAAKRGVSIKLLDFKDPVPASGDCIRQQVLLKQGLSDDEVKKITKSVKASGIKVSAQIQGNQVRISGKKRDDLQLMIAQLKKEMSDLELQFTNFRD